MKKKKNILVVIIITVLITTTLLLLFNINTEKKEKIEKETTILEINKEDNEIKDNTTIKAEKEKVTNNEVNTDKTTKTTTKKVNEEKVTNNKEEKTTKKSTTKKVEENKKTTTSSSKNNSKYTHEWGKEKDAVGKQYLYIVDETGKKVEGTITISYVGSDYSETKKVTTSGILLIKDIVTISDIKVK